MVLVSLALALLSETPQAPLQAPKASPEEKRSVICRRYTEIGSLAKTKRVCQTKEQWAQADMNARETAEGMQQSICSSSLDNCMEDDIFKDPIPK